MNKLLLVLLLITLSYKVNAQQKGSLNQELNQDLLKTRNIKRAGIIITVTGFTLFSTGLVRFANSPTECDPTSPTGNQGCHFTEIHGEGFLLAGSIVMAVGIPVWTFAKQKEQYGRIRLFPYFSSSSVNGIGLEITF
jgi:hypothetical protein